MTRPMERLREILRHRREVRRRWHWVPTRPLPPSPVPETAPNDNWVDLRLQGIRLTRSPSGECVVSLQGPAGGWVDVIRDRGDVISHIVEPGGIAGALERGVL